MWNIGNEFWFLNILMTFREFLNGQFGDVKNVQGLLDIHRMEKRLHTPVKKKGTSISRMMSAGKVKNATKPASLTSFKKPVKVPSILDNLGKSQIS